MATRRVAATERAATRALGRNLLSRLNVEAELELTSAAVEEAAAYLRKRGLDPRAEGVLFRTTTKMALIFNRYSEQ